MEQAGLRLFIYLFRYICC